MGPHDFDQAGGGMKNYYRRVFGRKSANGVSFKLVKG